mmetsp:Transcript_39027/g.37345  ORF Transcript_39027/g.37345 Transcript_39027/m.37345 type:complete len:135 (-) Transcript_39027:248-652(-)
MMWLPLYLQNDNNYSDYQASLVAAMYDLGCIFGSMLLGIFTDLTYSRRSPVTFLFLILSVGIQVLLIVVDPSNVGLYGFVVFMLGIGIGGVACVISGIACADFGKQKQLASNEKALATVSGIIDGTGSVGAAIG